MNIQHSSRSDSWGTPSDIIERSRTVLHTIDLDPASSAVFNHLIGATTYYDKEANGLSKPWVGSVFCNPPGGKEGNKSMACLFWEKLMQERRAGNITHAIFVAFSVEQLAVTQGRDFPPMTSFYICIPKKRIRFNHANGLPGPAPSHSNAIIYVPGTEDQSFQFGNHFEDLGAILNGFRR